MIYYLVAAALVVLDQVTKALVRAFLPLGERFTLIPNVVGLTYVQNTGMAFSSFSSHTVALAVLSLVISIAIIAVIHRDYFHSKAANWLLTLVLAGAVGNLIDRALIGYVTDMIEVLFMDFAVFNVADCFICVGIALLVVYVIFFDKSEKDGKKG